MALIEQRLNSVRGKAGFQKKHGMWKSKEWVAWNHMIQRCYNPKHKYYNRYGGRGITVCDRWRTSFVNFLNDMGLAPSKSHSLDRIRGNEMYEPSNCRWVLPKVQSNNRDYVTDSIATKARAVGFSKDLIYQRLKRGMTLDQALNTPKLRNRKAA